MSFADYTIGFAFLAGTLTAVTLAAWMITRRTFAHLSGLPRVLCLVLLVLAGLIGVNMAAGVLTILNRTSVLLIAIGSCVMVSIWASRHRPSGIRMEQPMTPDTEPPDAPLATALAATIVAAIVVYILGFIV